MRRIWDLREYTVCRIIGLSLGEKELRDLVKKLKVKCEDPMELHRLIVSTCKYENPISKLVERRIMQKYGNYLYLSPRKAFEYLKDDRSDIPIGALIWIASQDESLEPLVFRVVHMKELKALRQENDKSDELNCLRREVEELRKKITKLEVKKNNLLTERDELKKRVSELLKEIEKLKTENAILAFKFERVGGEKTFERMKKLEEELERLRSELKMLKKVRNDENKPNVIRSDVKKRSKRLKIAFIGGLDRLEDHYKKVAESFGCELHYHNGRGRVDNLESLVRRCDVIFCPVDINSRNVCRYIKELCKILGKKCIFLKRSSISRFRRTLEKMVCA